MNLVAEKQALVSTVQSPGWPVVVREMEKIVTEMQNEVYSVGYTDNDKSLALLRRVQAVRDFRDTLLNRISSHQFVNAKDAFIPVTMEAE